MKLANEEITICKKEMPAMSVAEADKLLQYLPGWEWVMLDGMARLRREFIFRTFQRALDFTNQVGALAEEANHHPAILTEWGRVTVSWWTHSIGGLHYNDFIMAARCDLAYTEFNAPES